MGRFGTGALVTAVGVILLYLAITGRLDNAVVAWRALNGASGSADGAGTGSTGAAGTVAAPTMPLIPWPFAVPRGK